MRVLVDFAEDELKDLNEISKSDKTSRTQVVRSAVREYAAARKLQQPDPLDEFFGMWAGKGIDGLDYERSLRSEWDREF